MGSNTPILRSNFPMLTKCHNCQEEYHPFLFTKVRNVLETTTHCIICRKIKGMKILVRQKNKDRNAPVNAELEEWEKEQIADLIVSQLATWRCRLIAQNMDIGDEAFNAIENQVRTQSNVSLDRQGLLNSIQEVFLQAQLDRGHENYNETNREVIEAQNEIGEGNNNGAPSNDNTEKSSDTQDESSSDDEEDFEHSTGVTADVSDAGVANNTGTEQVVNTGMPHGNITSFPIVEQSPPLPPIHVDNAWFRRANANVDLDEKLNRCIKVLADLTLLCCEVRRVDAETFPPGFMSERRIEYLEEWAEYVHNGINRARQRY